MGALVVGEVVAEKYRVDDVIGSGGGGAVYRATHLVLDRPVALKVLHPDGMTDTASARFLREARTLVRLRSEHVAEIFDVGELADGTPYLVMELLDGVDLDTLLDERGPLPVDEAVSYVLDACAALSEAHALGIVHRDLKPSNLFVVARPGGRRSVKLIDFGIAKVARENTLTESGSFLGTPAYMAPEQLASACAADARADIWALGVILFELVTRQRPFTALTLVNLITQITTTAPRAPSSCRADLPPAFDALVLRCLARAPADRFASVDDLAAALGAFAGRASRPDTLRLPAPPTPARVESPARARPPPPAPAAPAGATHRPLQVVAAIAGLFVLLAVGKWVVDRRATSGADALESRRGAEVETAAPSASALASSVPREAASDEAAGGPPAPTASPARLTTRAPTGRVRSGAPAPPQVSPVPAAPAPTTASPAPPRASANDIPAFRR